ncbi:MAG: hypothetical protein R2788_18265 [Saprospiraceae bacterium]
MSALTSVGVALYIEQWLAGQPGRPVCPRLRGVELADSVQRLAGQPGRLVCSIPWLGPLTIQDNSALTDCCKIHGLLESGEE